MTGRSTQAARFLLGVGLAAGDADARGNTPLHAAVQLGHAEMIELLFSFGASADARNDAGETPLDMVAIEYAAIPSLQEKYRMFSTHPLVDSIESAAAASTLRYAAGAPLSIWDGVPVAFKDMIPVAGYVMTDGSAANQAAGVNRTKDDLLVERFRELGAVVLQHAQRA